MPDRSTMMTSPEADNESNTHRSPTRTASPKVDKYGDVDVSTMTTTSPEMDHDNVDGDRSTTMTSPPPLGGGSTSEARRTPDSALHSRQNFSAPIVPDDMRSNNVSITSFVKSTTVVVMMTSSSSHLPATPTRFVRPPRSRHQVEAVSDLPLDGSQTGIALPLRQNGAPSRGYHLKSTSSHQPEPFTHSDSEVLETTFVGSAVRSTNPSTPRDIGADDAHDVTSIRLTTETFRSAVTSTSSSSLMTSSRRFQTSSLGRKSPSSSSTSDGTPSTISDGRSSSRPPLVARRPSSRSAEHRSLLTSSITDGDRSYFRPSTAVDARSDEPGPSSTSTTDELWTGSYAASRNESLVDLTRAGAVDVGTPKLVLGFSIVVIVILTATSTVWYSKCKIVRKSRTVVNFRLSGTLCTVL